PLGPGNLYPPTALRRRVRLEERPFGGFARGRLSVGCRQCTDGSKMVLFVTGLCSFHCFYCPVSDEKMYKDVVFADEKRVLRDEDVLDEAHAIRATGAGITGGDPLDAVERTCRYIRLLKEAFGPDFHTHLYTMSTDEDKICALEDDGPLLQERLQGRLAAPVADQAARGECRAALGRRDGGRDPREGDPRGSRPGTADARSRGPPSGAEGPHGPRRREEAPRGRAVDLAGARPDPREARVPRRGVSDRGRPRGGADSARVGGHRPHRTPRWSRLQGPSVPPRRS